MAIQVLQDAMGLGQALPQIGASLGKGLQNWGQYNQKQQQEQQLLQQQQQQQTALAKALEAAQGYEGEDALGQMSAFQAAINESGVNVKPETALEYMKTISSADAAQKKANAPDAESRQTLKANQGLIKGIAHDAKVAGSLYKDMDMLTSAIEGKNLSGPGLKGSLVRATRWMLGQGQPGDEQTLETLRKNAILSLGDLKGIRLTDVKLRFLEESLFNPKKSKAANREALRIYKNILEEKMSYPDKLKGLMSDDPNALYDSTLSLRLEDYTSDSPQGESITEEASVQEQFTPESFADRVRKRGKKK